MINKIFVTGGAGYVGAKLIPSLLDNGYEVTVLDLMIYGDSVLDDHHELKKIKGDIRDRELLEAIIPGHNAVIHLACISNDPSFELNPNLGKSINLDAFRPMVEISKESGVDRFIYASSSSVYGIKEVENVHEEMSLQPLTDYSLYKADCEKILQEYQSKDFTTVTVRPATVCGYSPRQRLDVVVNILTNLAYHKREVSVFGGSQLRPNIHIKDMVNVYLELLNADESLINGQVFNAGDENHSVLQLAEFAKEVIGEDVKLVQSSSDDNRSYHISSEKIHTVLGFTPSHSIKEAIADLKEAFELGLLKDPLNNPNYFNIKTMQKIELK
ncbi:MAG: SDR family oxidoreductase [Gammaproteobacteria bacterium]|nr:SDR family oxidoreductase [Gammaproteobacteria bacterium]